MSADEVLSRVSRFDFFAIMAPGFYILSTFVVVATAIYDNGAAVNAWVRLLSIVEKASSPWPMVIGIILLSYLIGTIPRAVPVNRADKICKYLFKWLQREGYVRFLYEDHFPFRRVLEKQLTALQSNGFANSIKIPKEGTTHSLFNFWKMIVCEQSPAAFAFTQGLEARVRLFSGMIWAGVAGIVVSLSGILWCGVAAGALTYPWLSPMLTLFIVSTVIALMFGLRLRVVRGDEVVYLFLAYIVLAQGPNKG